MRLALTKAVGLGAVGWIGETSVRELLGVSEEKGAL